jgi:nitrate/nitrite transport system substrate-binding protein
LIAARLGDEIAASAPGGLPMRFFDNGTVNYPQAFEGAWFLTQFERWGMIDARADYADIAARINQTQLYREAATAVNVAVPEEGASQVLIDGETWSDSTSPTAYAQRFPIRR